MALVSLCDGRYVFDLNDMTKDNNGNWIIVEDQRTHEKVFVKEFLKFRYVVPEPGESLSAQQKKNNDRTERYRARMEKIKTLLDQVAGKGGSVVVLLSVQRDRPDSCYLFKVTPCVDYLHWKDEELPQHLGVRQADALMRSLTVAMKTLHSIGLLHCDLKTDNVFVVGDEENGYEVKVSDFDDSFLLDDIPSSTDIVGTPEWESPELRAYQMSPTPLSQPDPAKPLTPASDVYSLGLIYHVYLAGRRPGGPGGLSPDLDIPRAAMIRQALRREWFQRTPNCDGLLQGLDMVQSMHQNRKTHLEVTRGGQPCANQDVKIAMVSQLYTTPQHQEKKPCGEIVFTGATDAKGCLDFNYGIPYTDNPDVSYLLVVGKKQYPIQWQAEGRNFTAAVEISDGFTMQAVQRGKPAAGVEIEMYSEDNGQVQEGPTFKTDKDGMARLDALNGKNWFALCRACRCPVVWKGNTGTVVLPDDFATTFRVLITRGGKPTAGERVRIALDSWSKEYATDRGGAVILRGLPGWHKGREVRYEASCKGEKGSFVLSNGSITLDLPQAEVHVTFAARVKGDQSLVSGLAFGLKQQGSDQWAAANYTVSEHPVTVGKLRPGKYMLVVTGVPKDYSLIGFKGNFAAVTIPEGAAEYTVTVWLNRQAPLLDKTFNPPHNGKYTRLVIYPSGNCELYYAGGKVNVSRNNLWIYDLDAYVKKP